MNNNNSNDIQSLDLPFIDKVVITTDEINALEKSNVLKTLTELVDKYEKYITYLKQEINVSQLKYEESKNSIARRSSAIATDYHKQVKSIFLGVIKCMDILDILNNNIRELKEDNELSKMFKNALRMFFETLDNELFHKYKISKIEVEIKKTLYNPKFHYAMSSEQVENIVENTIIGVLEQGFMYEEEVLRPTMVIISKDNKKN